MLDTLHVISLLMRIIFSVSLFGFSVASVTLFGVHPAFLLLFIPMIGLFIYHIVAGPEGNFIPALPMMVYGIAHAIKNRFLRNKWFYDHGSEVLFDPMSLPREDGSLVSVCSIRKLKNGYWVFSRREGNGNMCRRVHSSIDDSLQLEQKYVKEYCMMFSKYTAIGRAAVFFRVTLTDPARNSLDFVDELQREDERRRHAERNRQENERRAQRAESSRQPTRHVIIASNLLEPERAQQESSIQIEKSASRDMDV